MKKQVNRFNNQKGQALVEAILLMVVVIPLVVLATNLFIVWIAVVQNDEICSEACRAASKGRLEVKGNMQAMVRDVIERNSLKRKNGLVAFNVKSIAVSPDAAALALKIDALSLSGGTVDGEVTVKTECSVKLLGVVEPMRFLSCRTYPFSCRVANH